VALFRVLSFVVALLASAGAVWVAGGRAVALSRAERPGTGLDVMSQVRAWREGFVADRGQLRIALLGDSMLMSHQGAPSVPARLVKLVNQARPSGSQVSLRPLPLSGWTMMGQYCALDEIIEAKPSLVVIELNPRALQPGGLGWYSFPELAGLIRGRRLWEAALLPLSDVGVTADRLLFYRLLVTMQLEGAWRAVTNRQAQILNSWGIFEGWTEKVTGVESMSERRMAAWNASMDRLTTPGKAGPNRVQMEMMLSAMLGGVAYRGNHRVEMLGAVLADLARAHIPVLLWVSPINVERVRSLGLSTDGLGRSIATLRKVAAEHGAQFLDLHQALPASAFRDAGDHFTVAGPDNGTSLVAAPLARAIARALQ
jgi:hypothetical protein